ncbi:hypothetical protein BDF20DRAFT_860491 [Mycotypha africana]|uniref:uncharacterized protein n=1 Tax=Mycotypha africana TaxID=64632 RepID=UPI0023010334|nr:uncharacterized protein BDF20DRAFT_860491 [Mycotypha africana]KAI8984546.1 hypothetical protein BDF20DRAFT_860491 [Mycotypha africana]
MPRRQTRRAGPSTQSRSAHTMPSQRQAPPPPPQQQPHVPVQHQQAPPPAVAQPRQPGLFGQMASTAAGVAVGSAVGHTMANGVSAMFGGRSDNNEPQQAQPQEQYQQQTYQPMAAQNQNGISCEADAKAFTQCLEATNNDMSACKWYLDALKQCQQMASQY